MPQGMPKVDQEIEKICDKLAPNNEVLRGNLNFYMHSLVITTIREYRKMMAEDTNTYNPEEVRHG